MALTKAQLIDLNGDELILDLDADTSITADTDDQIDIKIAGADDFRFTANTFTALAGSGVVIPDGGLTLGSTAVSSTAAELNLLDGVSGLVQADLTKLAAIDATAAEINLIDGGTSRGTTAVADADGILTNDGGTMRMTSAATFKTYFQEGISQAYDDFTIGDAAVLITTSSGNITIDAAASDSDIIFKGTDGGADKVFATFDGSAGGDLFLNGGLIDLKNDGSNVSQIKFYCESSNAHAQTLIGAPHAQSADNTLTLPDGANGVLLSTTSTATVTNKTFTSPKINENVALTATATELNTTDGVTLGTAIASKVVTTDSSIDTTGQRNLTISGELDAATLDISGAIDVAGNSVLASVDVTAVATAATFEPDGDTAAGDNAAIGFTAAEGLILTGQGTTNDVTIKNDADADVIEIPTGSVNVTMAGTLAVTGVVSGAGFTAGSATLAESELELLDGLTAGTAIASKVVTTDANIDNSGMRNLTISGELDAATLDISGAIDVAGTTNLDVVDIDGAVDMASTLQVDGVATFTAVPVFPNNTIETADIQADAITAAKIADNAVVTAGINADAVTGAEIADDAINSEHYTDGSIDTAHIGADQITNAKIADDQIDSEHYVDGSIDTAHIAADQITNAKIADDQIDSEHYVDGSIDTAHLADGQITIAKLATAVLTGATDIGADLVDADLFLVDDGAGGTLRKTTAERIKTYIGGGTSWQAIKTGAYTAVAGQGVFANTTSSAFTVTLPASPALGDEVTVVDYAGTFDSNACTIGRNSQPIQGVAEDLVVSTERASFTLVYVDGTQGWLFKND